MEGSSPTALGKKPRAAVLRAAILRELNNRWMTPAELAEKLNRDPKSLAEKHLSKLVKEGLVERRHAQPNHPDQAYRAIQAAPVDKMAAKNRSQN